MAVFGDKQKLCRLLPEVVATPAAICDKSATKWYGRVARSLDYALRQAFPTFRRLPVAFQGPLEMTEAKGGNIRAMKEESLRLIW